MTATPLWWTAMHDDIAAGPLLDRLVANRYRGVRILSKAVRTGSTPIPAFVEAVADAVQAADGQLTVAVDLPGLRPFVTTRSELVADQVISLAAAGDTDDVDTEVRVDGFDTLYQVDRGDVLVAAEGTIALEVVERHLTSLRARVLLGGTILPGRSLDRASGSLLGTGVAAGDLALAEALAARVGGTCLWLSNATVETIAEVAGRVGPVPVWPKIERRLPSSEFVTLAEATGTVIVGRQDLVAVEGLRSAAVEDEIVAAAASASATVIVGSVVGSALSHDPPHEAHELLLLSYSCRGSAVEVLLSETCAVATPDDVARRWRSLHEL